MKIYLQKYSEQYKIINYPGGELQVRLLGDTLAALKRHAEGPWEVDLIARIYTPEDIIILSLLASAIYGVDPRLRIHLHLPYLPYARADRRFVEGDCYGLATFAAIINALKFDSVITLDPHSSVAETQIERLVKTSPKHYIERAISLFAKANKVKSVDILLPDAGAYDRYTGMISRVIDGVDTHFYCATKKRNPSTGEFMGFEVPDTTGPTLMVDDICDGGGTFIGIANELRKNGTNHPLGLYVTHGIFSKGFGPLEDAGIEYTYCTDSYSTILTLDHMVTQFPIKF